MMKLFRKISLLHWLLIATFFKEIVFMTIIPLWHGPDEQAHFAQVQYYAESKRQFPNDAKLNTTSQEVLVSERLLGTERDGFGKNLFTHNPAFRIEYTTTTEGKYEQIIRSLPQASRTTLVKKEATVYPPLFYIISALFYLLSYPLSLIDRVFIARLASVCMGVATVWLVHKIARIISPKSELFAITAATLVSFQPMFSFLTASVNSDNLMNLLFTLFLYLAVKTIDEQQLSLKSISSFIGVLIAGFLTKPHFVIALPLLLIVPLFFWASFIRHTKTHRRIVLVFILAGVSLVLWRLSPQLTRVVKGQPIAFSEVSLTAIREPLSPIPLSEHVRWTIRHTIAEVIPWYWGVFNWLGVTLPRVVNRVINRVTIVAAVGILVWFFQHRRPRLWKKETKDLLFLAVSSGVFFAVLLLWDWLFVRGHSFSFGMQGRYYFPLLSAHMIWLLVGLVTLVPKKWSRFKSTWIKIIGLGMVALNLVGLHTLTAAYYNLSSLSIFFNQVSQYKPFLFKFPLNLLWLLIYAVTLIVFIYYYVTYADNSRNRR